MRVDSGEQGRLLTKPTARLDTAPQNNLLWGKPSVVSVNEITLHIMRVNVFVQKGNATNVNLSVEG